MSKEIPNNALVLVADGGKAVLLRNVGAGDKLALHEEQRLTPKHLADAGPSGARPDEQTPQQTDEATFAKQLAQAMYKMYEAGAFKHLVLVADPQTLGQIRDAMHKTVAASVLFSLHKDLTNHSVHDIAAALVA